MILSHKLISLLLLLIFLTLNVSNSTNILCFETERKALLSFKQHVKDPHGKLLSWVSEEENCCKWNGIVCDNSIGHVQELRLAADWAEDEENYRPLQGKINPSLLDLKQLSHLDLSHNYFKGTQIPNFIGSLVSLRYLDLSWAGFEGVIPHQLGNLSSLRYLGLRGSALYVENHRGYSLPLKDLTLYVENLHWLSSLALLEYLDMSWVNLSKASDYWLHAINKLPSLLELHLGDCELGHIHHLSYTNFTSLSILNIYGNNFNSIIPDWVFSLSNHVKLDLSYSQFIGSFPNGSFSLTFLTTLYVSGNFLRCTIPSYFYSFSTLEYMYLGQNNLGVVSNSIRNLTYLFHLYLSRNKLNGPLPESLGSLSTLQFLDISNNLFEGAVSKVHFSNLTNLFSLRASENSLSLRVNPNWIPPFHLDNLLLGSWNLGSPQFPTWLKSQKGISGIDLSNIGISEAIDSFNVHELDLSNNSLSGDISEFLCHQTSDSLVLSILRLGENLLSGNIPDCWMYYPLLMVIDLSNNNLTGAIPNSMGSLDGLFSLHLRNNSLSGEIPSSLRNCKDLTVLDLGLTKFVGSIPNWIGICFPYLMILIIRSNKLNDHIPIELCRLTSLQIFDAANNNLSGTIPRCFDNFSQIATKKNLRGEYKIFYSIYWSLESAIVATKGREDKYDTFLGLVTSLDLSNNSLSGEIPKQLTSLQVLCNMSSLETLDLSRNKLSENIPTSISSLTFLSHLNLSYNNLSEEIPLGTQLHTFDNYSFIGNQLCGPPFTKNCHGKNNITHQFNDEEEYWFRLCIAMGFVVGFLGIIAPLLTCRIWRHAYYWFWQDYMLFKIVGWFINFKNMLRI
ncbi:hypothetical protein UlMin_004872 [Ulmus minor]